MLDYYDLMDQREMLDIQTYLDFENDEKIEAPMGVGTSIEEQKQYKVL